MTAEPTSERVTLWMALKDLGWFWGLFSVVVSGPSILQIAQFAFPAFRLTPFLQEAIVEPWRQAMAMLGAIVEPLALPLIHWLGGLLHLELAIDPIWRPLFALMTVLWASQLRSRVRHADLLRKQGRQQTAVGWLNIVLQLPGLLLGALGAGAAMSLGGWLAQGLATALPVLLFFFVTAFAAAIRAVVYVLTGARENIALAMRGSLSNLILVPLFGGAGFALGAGLSFAPGLAHAAGVVALAGVVGVWGSAAVWVGLSRAAGDRHVDFMVLREGLTTLGGFVAAGIIVVADLVVRLLGGG